MSKWHGGKGSVQRPQTDKEKFDENFEKIFGSKKKDGDKRKKPNSK
jgi:hypothetical protein